ncbi:MAG: NifB/NifX family molybdenum-iron cluster-binding protein [Bacteroidales bacterium]|nr:NifB/NifX family molybdenum-iron cluster-binding protein [Bacteroidales bacterium]MBK7628632.1 NifB/NifX family molybdenum-iron cluster-binding protein [Bacteroidales bacterium]
MKIAVPVTRDNQIDGHFGHCESYSVFTINNKKEITEKKNVESPQGCGCKSNIASVLADDGVSIMLAGGIGGGAINVLNSSGIDVIRGCSGDATEVVKLYLKGLVEDSGSSCHQHQAHHGHGHDHDHEHGHQCNHN